MIKNKEHFMEGICSLIARQGAMRSAGCVRRRAVVSLNTDSKREAVFFNLSHCSNLEKCRTFSNYKYL